MLAASLILLHFLVQAESIPALINTVEMKIVLQIHSSDKKITTALNLSSKPNTFSISPQDELLCDKQYFHSLFASV